MPGGIGPPAAEVLHDAVDTRLEPGERQPPRVGKGEEAIDLDLPGAPPNLAGAGRVEEQRGDEGVGLISRGRGRRSPRLKGIGAIGARWLG